MTDQERLAELRRRRAEAARGRGSQRRGRLVPLALIAVIVLIAGGALGVVLGQGSGDEPAQPAATTDRPASARTEPPAEPDPEPTTPPTTASTSAADPRDPASWPRTGAAARKTRVPILMYHLVAAAPAGTAYPGLWVPPAELEAHVAALAKAGFTGVTLGEVWDAWHGEGSLPDQPVVLSFDDGSISQVLAGAPILKDAGWPGVLNLTLDHVGSKGIPTWGVKRLIKQGWDIDSHTLTHPDVTGLSGDALEEELVGSRQQIKDKFGVTPRFFCYPAGRNDPASRAAVKAAGYLAATTTEPGLAARGDDPFGLPRLRVDPGVSGAGIVALAKGDSLPAGGAGE